MLFAYDDLNLIFQLENKITSIASVFKKSQTCRFVIDFEMNTPNIYPPFCRRYSGKCSRESEFYTLCKSHVAKIKFIGTAYQSYHFYLCTIEQRLGENIDVSNITLSRTYRSCGEYDPFNPPPPATYFGFVINKLLGKFNIYERDSNLPIACKNHP